MAIDEKDLNVFVCSDNGILKGVSVGTKCCISKNFDSLSSLTKLSSYTCIGAGDDASEILVANRVPEVKSFNINDKCYRGPVSVGVEGTTGHVVGVTRFSGGVITTDQSGRVKKDNETCFNAIDFEVESQGKLAKKDVTWKTEEDREKHVEKLKIGRKLSRMRRCPPGLMAEDKQRCLIGVGGKEVDLQVWDLDNTKEPVFKAKNVRSDSLEMRVPVWISDLTFLSSTTLAVCSRHGHIRKYDMSGSQRRPVCDLVWQEKDENMTCTALCAVDQDQVIVGTSTGKLGLWDFRKNAGYRGLIRKYKGCVGAVKDISFSNGYFGVVGLDRFLRVFHISDDKPRFNVYLKSKLSGVVLLPGFDPENSIEQESEKAEGQEEAEGNSDVEVLDDFEDDIKNSIADCRLEQLLSLPSSTYKDKSHIFYEFFCQTKKQRKLLKTTDSETERDKALDKIREKFAAFKSAHLAGADEASEKPAKRRKVK